MLLLFIIFIYELFEQILENVITIYIQQMKELKLLNILNIQSSTSKFIELINISCFRLVKIKALRILTPVENIPQQILVWKIFQIIIFYIVTYVIQTNVNQCVDIRVGMLGLR